MRKRVLTRIICTSVLIAGCYGSNTYAVNDLGQAVQNLGGNQLLVNAADAIFTTCIGLATTSQTLTPDQMELGGRCADMSQQGFLLGNVTSSTPVTPFDNFGLAAGPNGGAAYLDLLRQFTGEEASTQGRYATEGAASQFKNLAGRLGAIRRGARSSGLAFTLQGVDVLTLANSDDIDRQNLTGGGAGDADGDTGFAWFANIEYGFGDRDSTGFENGYDADSYGAVIGIDYAVNESFVVGAAVAFNSAEIDFDRATSSTIESVSGGDLETDSINFSVFGNYVRGQLYASAILSLGRADYDMSRSVVIPTSSGGISGGLGSVSSEVTSDTDSDQLGLQAQVGYTFGQGATTFDLYGGIDYVNLEIDAFSETGSALALSFGDQDIDSVQGFVGGAIRMAISTDSGVWVPYASAELRQEFDNNKRFLSARYVGTTRTPTEIFQGETDNFEIPTDDPDDSFFDVSVGVVGQFGNNLALFAQFSSIVGLKDISANLVTIGIRGSF